MPTPGSHAHDMKRTRIRRELEHQGVADPDAEERANREAAKEVGGPSPATASDRARGPQGERGRGGGPGAVIDLRSPAFSDNTTIPPRHTQAGENRPPPLEWSTGPEETAEFVLLCEDRDAPDGTATHWLVTGIEPRTTSIDGTSLPADARVWPNSFGGERYDGPLPPIGDEPHRYFFQVFALKRRLDVEPDRGVDALHREIDKHRVATGTLIGLYAR